MSLEAGLVSSIADYSSAGLGEFYDNRIRPLFDTLGNSFEAFDRGREGAIPYVRWWGASGAALAIGWATSHEATGPRRLCGQLLMAGGLSSAGILILTGLSYT